jgi:hypothetical protein
MRGMRRAAIVAAVAVGAALAAPAAAGASGGDGLEPGGLTDFDERVTVNVVFVGFDEHEAPWSQVRRQLLSRVEPVTISRLFYGITERLGLDYSYDYRPYYTSRSWEDSFFSYLRSISVAKPLTEFQQAYNAQAGRLDVTNNHWIDAPTVEKRLIDTAPHGVDTRSPTIYFVNWYGRPDFGFHVYTKIGEPDPDTGKDFGLEEDSRKLVAWGGTTPDDEETGLGRRGVNRVWFYDLSAGPESWGGSFDVTNPDLDGDDEPDYRIPPSWEYGSYRPKSALAGDLGKVIRYVGVNMLFTASPVYPPYFNADRLPRHVDLDTNTAEGWPGVDASRQYIKRDLFLAEERELPAGFPLTDDYQDLSFSGDLKRCFDGEFRDPPFSCYPEYQHYPPDANSFLWSAFNHPRYLDRDADYEAALVNYSFSPDAFTPLGYAGDNQLDGTQSGVFSFISPGIVEAGYGLTTTMIHEYGHHSSMSHPHDGYDPTSGVDYEPTGPFFYAWLGDESNTMMSYIDVNWDFSQFDRDNSARHHAGGYAVVANRIAADILRDRDRDRARRELLAADDALEDAQDAIEDYDYDEMLEDAARAYGHVRRGADKAGVRVRVRQPSTWTVLPQSRGSRMVPGTIDLEPAANRKRGLQQRR